MSAPRRCLSSADLPRYWREYIVEIVGEDAIEDWLNQKRKDFDGHSILDRLNTPDGRQHAYNFVFSRGAKLGIPYALGERPPYLDEKASPLLPPGKVS